MKVSVIGQGYVGLTVALYAAKNHEVIGFDLNRELIKALNNGVNHVEGLQTDLLSSALISKTYKATVDPADLNESEVIVIAVPTPLTKERTPDLTYLQKACETISVHVKNKALIINESTSFPGTVRDFIKPLIESKSNQNHYYAVSPERVDPGRVDWNQHNTPRLYAGLDEDASRLTHEFYSKFCSNLIKVETPEIAEAAKLFENTFRQVNIALVNEFAQICHALDIPVRDVLEAAETKPYGFMKFNPSAGVGGHCIPVDPSYLAYVSKEHGVVAQFIELANEVNLNMAQYVISRVKEDNNNSLHGKKVQLIGVAYKPNVADVRESPAVELSKLLEKEGAIISWHDPLVEEWNFSKSSELGAEISIVVTLHEIIDVNALKEKSKYVFDTTGKIPDVRQL